MGSERYSSVTGREGEPQGRVFSVPPLLDFCVVYVGIIPPPPPLSHSLLTSLLYLIPDLDHFG